MLTALLMVQLAVVPAPPPYPFDVGETLHYEARLGPLPVGNATATVARRATVRGEEVFVFSMTGQGGPPGLRGRYEMTSWTGIAEFTSRRFHRRIARPGHVADEQFIILPDSGRYRETGDGQEWATPAAPLDELAFLYYLRTVPLEVGRSYRIPRYFQTGWNPIRVSVTGREMVELADGSRIPCLALRITAAGTTTRVWLTDDARRLPARLEVPLVVGEVTLVLRAGEAGGTGERGNGGTGERGNGGTGEAKVAAGTIVGQASVPVPGSTAPRSARPFVGNPEQPAV